MTHRIHEQTGTVTLEHAGALMAAFVHTTICRAWLLLLHHLDDGDRQEGGEQDAQQGPESA